MFLRYKAGQRFGRHIDESIDLGDGKRTHYTLLIYLSGGSRSKTRNDNTQDSASETIVGGETVFYGPRNALVAEVDVFLLLLCYVLLILPSFPYLNPLHQMGQFIQKIRSPKSYLGKKK
mgnify:CR=1 FL=1